MGKLLERFLPALKITADQRKPVSKKPVSDKPEWVYSHNKFNMFATVAIDLRFFNIFFFCRDFIVNLICETT